MASRRTRIKGLASIPQRRKPTTAPSTEETGEIPPIIEQEEIVEPNLTSTTVVAHGENQEKIAQPPPDINIQVTENLIKAPQVITAPKPQPNPSGEKDVKKAAVSVVTNSDVEYPVPPPSPSKANRSRIKAVPKFGQRHASFSASESEDESKRNYRHRNDSVCSTTSGFQDSIPECPSPQKPKEFNSVIQRKCRRTEQSRKLAEARRDFYLKFGNKKPDRQKLTMIDLIFYNPTTNPMSQENKKKDESETIAETETVDENNEAEIVDDPEEVAKSGSDEENEMPAPQLKIGPQGEIVIDEKSLVIENKANKKNRENLQKLKVVNGNLETGYGIFKRAKRSKDWSKQETLKFYKALNTIGTDFTLMCEFFPRRSRRELKMKFKKEERVNKNLIDRAVMEPCGFDFNEFKHEVDLEEKEFEELEKQKERELQIRKEAGRKRKSSLASKEGSAKEPKLNGKKRGAKSLDIMNVLEESDADVSEVESEEDAEDRILQNMQKPTRSGRVPKIIKRYNAPAIRPETPQPPVTTKPGSLMVVASTGPTGEPVYKVFMVTGDPNNQPVDLNKSVSSLSKAIQLQTNDTGVKNIFSLTTNAVDNTVNGQSEVESNQNIPADSEENNITVPAGPAGCDVSCCIPVENNVTICHETETTDLMETETAALVETEATALVETETAALVETETTALVETETTALVETETAALVETETAALVETETTALVETETTDLMETETAALVETETAALVETETAALVETETNKADLANGLVS